MFDMNDEAFVEIMKSKGAAKVVQQVADDLANSAEGFAGTVHGARVVMRRENGETPTRTRAAIIVSHPTQTGRNAGMDALKAVTGGRS